MWDFFTAARDRYLAFYRDGIRTKKQQHPSATPELLLLPEGHCDDDELYRLYRMDLVWKNEAQQHKMSEFNLDPLPSLPAMLEGSVGAMSVICYPMIWNAVEFRFAPIHTDWISLDRWYRKWLNVDDDNFRDADGLAGVVHHTARPVVEGEQMVLAVDFGSAPPNAVMELLQVLAELGIPRVEVGSFSYVATTA